MANVMATVAIVVLLVIVAVLAAIVYQDHASEQTFIINPATTTTTATSTLIEQQTQATSTVTTSVILTSTETSEQQSQSPSSSITLVTQQTETSGPGLFMQNVAFSDGNITVSVSNLGGGTTITGYGNTGQIARWLGSIIVSDGTHYYRYAWECMPSSYCAVAPGPWRYFSFEGSSTSTDITWKAGPANYYGLPMTVNGLASIPLGFHWNPSATYTVYLEDTNDTIVAQMTVIASS